MARWRLTASHYLLVRDWNGQDIEWEYKEQTNEGRMIRKMYPVPLLLDIDDPSMRNSPDGIVVCDGGQDAQPKDFVFHGEPTPDMEPLNDEARMISDICRPKWQHPIESLPGNYAESLIDQFQKQMTEFKPSPAVSKDDFALLQQQVKELSEQNAMLIKQIKSEKRA